MTKPPILLVLLLAVCGVVSVEGSLGTCLRQTFFGQDDWDRRFSPRVPAKAQSLRPARKYAQMFARAPADNGLVIVVPAGSGPINLSDLLGVGGPNGGVPTTTTSTSTSTTKTTAQVPTTTLATTASSSPSSTSTPQETNSAPGPGGNVSGTPSEEPNGVVYTCKNEFIDFSQANAMSKFSFVWCPQNAYQTSNSVVWRLTPECGTTMVYPWDFKYGRIEGRIRIGATSGVVTAMLLLGPAPSDEIDWEWVGKDLTQAQTTYYVQAHNVDSLPMAIPIAQPGGGDLSTTFQNYAIELNRDSVKWFINGSPVRTLVKGTKEFPSAASRPRMGIWDGSQTGGWAGSVNWSLGPFTAEMQWFNFTSYC
ncbi:transglycosylase [Coemansia pectinata]|uniref:Transglycosylase n=1 Tax=Coemansia pectinata TaxID=1052879 RepID=A0A9W8LBH9_9FUNG|nr:transglycosylase [Coemansia pectinata]